MSSANWVDNSGYTHLELYPSGSYKSFVPTVDTEWKLGSVEIKLPADHEVHFYENGNFKSFTLCEDIEIGAFGQSVCVAALTVISFFENGKIQSLTLAAQRNGFFSSKNWTYQGREYAPGTVIEFAADGKVVGVSVK